MRFYVGISFFLLLLCAMQLADGYNPHQHHQHHGSTTHHFQHQGGGGSDDVDSARPGVELLAVSGCPNDSDPRKSTSHCPVDGGTRLTVRGRGFPRNGILGIQLVNARDRSASRLSCDGITHSQMLPTLLVFCRLPPAQEGAAYHLRLVTRSGAYLLRSAIHYVKKEILDSNVGDDAGTKADSTKPKVGNWDDYETLGIGGLKPQLEELFRRAFSSRLTANSKIANEIGVRHVKGVILYGPPGTGKTLIARTVGKMLNAKSVKIVSGPEIMSKFVGESEKNLRGLFAAAEQDAQKFGANAGLHVIVMDEIDAIMRPRGAGDDSGARAVYDGVTTQMLAYMDGFKSSNNLLIIGLTNRLSSMDKALLRPGRFEVQIRIPLPTDEGRLEIYKIHTKKLRDNDYLAPDVSLGALARRSAALSGADIEGIVRAAVSYAFERHQKAAQERMTVDEGEAEEPKFQVNANDFNRGLKEIVAAKGAAVNTQPFLERGVVLYNQRLKQSIERLTTLTDRMRESEALRRLRIVIDGPSNSGRSAIAALVARHSRFAYVNVITPESLVGLSTGQRVAALQNAFDEAANVMHACIVLDRVDNIIEFNPVQNHFNSIIAQELSTLLDRSVSLVPSSHTASRLLVVMTTNGDDALKYLTPKGQYDAKEHLSLLSKADQAVVLKAYRVFESDKALREAMAHLPSSIGIKQLLFYIDVARSRYGVAVPNAPPLYDVSEDVFKAAAGDDSGNGVDEAAPAARPPVDPKQSLYLTVDQFATIMKEFGVSGGQESLEPVSFQATSLDL